MIRADRELLAELARLNSDVTPLPLRMMDETATVDEQYAFAERLIAMARQLQARAAEVVIKGDVADNTVYHVER